jgi:alcohol oxidase
MMYTRAAASDYDDWATLHDNPGWGSKELIPLLQKVQVGKATIIPINSQFRLGRNV